MPVRVKRSPGHAGIRADVRDLTAASVSITFYRLSIVSTWKALTAFRVCDNYSTAFR